jgi:hypothetical protein
MRPEQELSAEQLLNLERSFSDVCGQFIAPDAESAASFSQLLE